MDQRDGRPGDLPPGTTPTVPTLGELRAVNEQLLIAGLREQELAAVLEGERASLAAILACIPDGVMVVDPQGQPVLTNAAYTRMSEQSAAGTVLEGLDGQPLPPGEAPWSHVERGAAFTLQFSATTAGTRRWFEARGQPIAPGATAGAVIVIRDISVHKGLEQALHHQALHDPLTGVPNRSLFHDRLAGAVRAAARARGPLAVLLLDVDHFKEINDTHGHQVGDGLLQELAARLTQVLRASDTVARLGGDEFALLLPGTDQAGAVETAGKIRAGVTRSITVEGQVLHVTVSIGIALATDGRAEPRTLLREADMAMYAAKRTGSGHALYDARQHGGPTSRRRGDELSAAIQAGRLVVYYQPQVSVGGAGDAPSGQIVGMEALVRWAHPERGLLLPEDFIPLAEGTGLIIPLLARVLEDALRQCALWQRAAGPLTMSVNLSMANLHDPNLRAMVAAALARHGLPATLLRLELTESMVMADPATSIRVLEGLRSLGVHVVIDDFGTGYSSLAYLTRVPADELKIDRSFLRQGSANDAAVVRAISALGHGLGMRVVAEGVEDRQTYALVERLGCDAAQGYYVSWPLPAATLDPRLSAQDRWVT